MTGARYLLATGTAAAALVSTVPAVQHGSAAKRLEVGDRSGTTAFVVPASARLLTAVPSGSRAVASATHLTVVRTSDGATLFTGSLATFKALSVAPGTALQVHVQRPARYAALQAAAVLHWSS
jgi:hypothetical protein